MPNASFEPTPDNLPAVRQFLWDCIADHASLEWDAAVFLAGELATIATIRSRLTFDMNVEVSGPCVWVCVEDLSALLPLPTRFVAGDVDPAIERHLLVVELASDRWGFELTDSGARVWFEICWQEGPDPSGGRHSDVAFRADTTPGSVLAECDPP